MTGRVVATFSIVAADVEAGDLGIAVASKFLAAGAVVPWATAGVGAVATQALADTGAAPRALAMMRDGAGAEEALRRVLADDPLADRRQIGLVDSRGGAAAHSGSGCMAWAGHRVGRGYACQGNILTGPETVEAMAAAFEAAPGPLADRLTAALAAGDRAGGDRRGRQSAGLTVVREKGGYLGGNDVLVDLRVDDHADPVGELSRLLDLHTLYFGSSPPADRLPLEGALLDELRAMMRRAGHDPGGAGGWDAGLEAALDAFFGTENLEERVDLKARTVDRPALDHLRRLFPAAGA